MWKVLPLHFLDTPLMYSAEAHVPYWAGSCRRCWQRGHPAPSVCHSDGRSFVAWSMHTQVRNRQKMNIDANKQHPVRVHMPFRETDRLSDTLNQKQGHNTKGSTTSFCTPNHSRGLGGLNGEHRSRQTFFLSRCHVIYVIWRSWRWDGRTGGERLRRGPCCQVEVGGWGCYDQRRGRCLLMFMSRTSADGYLRDEKGRGGGERVKKKIQSINIQKRYFE